MTMVWKRELVVCFEVWDDRKQQIGFMKCCYQVVISRSCERIWCTLPWWDDRVPIPMHFLSWINSDPLRQQVGTWQYLRVLTWRYGKNSIFFPNNNNKNKKIKKVSRVWLLGQKMSKLAKKVEWTNFGPNSVTFKKPVEGAFNLGAPSTVIDNGFFFFVSTLFIL